MTTITATVSHTIKIDRWDHQIYHYVINLSNGISAKRQAQGGTQAVAFELQSPTGTTASKNIKRLISKFGKEPGYVIVNLETEEVLMCG